LKSKSKRRRENILAAYAADPRISAVVYLVDDPAVGRAISASARRLGISGLIRVTPVQWSGGAGTGQNRSGDRAAHRSGGRAEHRARSAREWPPNASRERAP
jgi:hypothetical protein